VAVLSDSGINDGQARHTGRICDRGFCAYYRRNAFGVPGNTSNLNTIAISIMTESKLEKTKCPSMPSSMQSLSSFQSIWQAKMEGTVDETIAKTYNSGYSLVVTHLTTNPPVRCLNRAERTGSLVFNVLWSYVPVKPATAIICLSIRVVLELPHWQPPYLFKARVRSSCSLAHC
jgi:hypothetical protein